MKVSRSINDENIDFYKKIGQEIVNYRKLKGISQERLAAVLGVSFQQIGFCIPHLKLTSENLIITEN